MCHLKWNFIGNIATSIILMNLLRSESVTFLMNEPSAPSYKTHLVPVCLGNIYCMLGPLWWITMGAMASRITSLTIVYSTVYSSADQRKHQSPASLALVRGIRRGPVNSPHKWPVTRKILPFDDVIMLPLKIHSYIFPYRLYFLCWNYSLSSGWHIIAA